MEHRELVVGRQDPLRRHYKTVPRDAWIQDHAETVGGATIDPFHGLVIAGSREEEAWGVGIHRSVGGFHDQPNPGDVLCAALASCMDTTLRMLAARLRISIVELTVRVTGDIDVRGTLAVSQEVQVGFQQLHCALDLEVGEGVAQEAVDRLIRATERACVVLQTVRRGVPVSLELADDGLEVSSNMSSGQGG